MRAIVALPLLLLTALAWAEDFEQLTLTDGRVLVGRYDPAAGRLYLRDARGGKSRMEIAVTEDQIVERKPWLAAPGDGPAAERAKPADRSPTAALARRWADLEEEERSLEARRQAVDQEKGRIMEEFDRLFLVAVDCAEIPWPGAVAQGKPGEADYENTRRSVGELNGALARLAKARDSKAMSQSTAKGLADTIRMYRSIYDRSKKRPLPDLFEFSKAAKPGR